MVSSMSDQARAEIHVPADLPVADRRRQITHAAAAAVDRLINQEKHDPTGLILTVHRDMDSQYPTYVVTATVDEKNSSPIAVE